MAQDFWGSSGFASLERSPSGLVATPAWFARFLAGDELMPPDEAGPNERALHARLAVEPLADVVPAELAAVEDADARENWSEFLRFRDRVRRFPSLEACYVDLFSRASVDLAPPFVDALAQAIVRAILDGSEDAWMCRAGEMLFRRQRMSTEAGQVLAADAATLEHFSETGGFGAVGRLLKRQRTEMPEVKMDVLNHENAPLYFLRDELHSFVLDLTPGREGAAALARVLESWVLRLTGARVAITPIASVDDPRWRWHVGLDVDASAMLDALYRGELLEASHLERLAVLFRLEFADPAQASAELAGRPVYLGLACRPDRTLKLKPQNLVANLPLSHA